MRQRLWGGSWGSEGGAALGGSRRWSVCFGGTRSRASGDRGGQWGPSLIGVHRGRVSGLPRAAYERGSGTAVRGHWPFVAGHVVPSRLPPF